MGLQISEPVVVTYSKPGEKRWGFHQFPALTRYPDGRIVLVYADAEDASETHGGRAPAFESVDGETWMPFRGEPAPIRPHFSVSALDNGEFLIVPAKPYFDANSIGFGFPEPVAVADVYGTLYSYRCDELPEAVTDDLGRLPAIRFDPESRTWNEERVTYDMQDRVAWRREGSTVLPRPFFERPVVSYRGTYLYPDYRVRFALPDGRFAPKGCTWLMASEDDCHHFSRRALVAGDPSGHDLCGEPALAVTSDDRLVCVVRRTDHIQKPMAITWSYDDGRTWTPVVDLFGFGVFPGLLALANGKLLLSFGRPGVHVAVSEDGTGRTWDSVESIIAGDRAAVQRDTCGYTSLLAIDQSTALIAYSDFNAVDPSGAGCKSICVRRIETT